MVSVNLWFLVAQGLLAASSADILARVTGQPVSQAVQVDFQFTLISEPGTPSPEVLDQKMAAYRAKLPADRLGFDQAIAEYRKTLTERIESKGNMRLVMAPDFTAIRMEQVLGDAFWDIRQGADSFFFYSNNHVFITNDSDRKVQRSGDMARSLLEMPGKLSPEWINALRADDTTLTRTPDHLTLQRGSKTVTLEAGGKQVVSTEENFSSDRTDRVDYSEFRDFGGIRFPAKVTRTVNSPEGQRMIFIYEITNVKISNDFKVPLINDEVGLVKVNDSRFSPPLQYLAFHSLPERSLVEKWTKNSNALDKHNADAQAAASLQNSGGKSD